MFCGVEVFWDVGLEFLLQGVLDFWSRDLSESGLCVIFYGCIFGWKLESFFIC